MKVIFSHGKESGPWGTKIKRLAETAKGQNFSVESIDYTHTLNPDERAALLNQHLSHELAPAILVGSSMGGYVSTVNATHPNVRGLFLMAPALYMQGYQQQQYQVNCPCEIVHGWVDDIVPIEHSIKFAKQSQITLHAVAAGHTLNDVLDTVDNLFLQFLSSSTA